MSRKEEELAALRKQNKESRRRHAVSDFRDRLKKIATKKFRTCFIAALSEFETVFGMELWGHHLPESDLTCQQKANRSRWEQIRKNILDKGNAQSRALGMEIDLHQIDFLGYHINCGGKRDE